MHSSRISHPSRISLGNGCDGPILRVLEIKALKSVPNAPTSHPFVERLIGTVRRELLDQTMFWDAPDWECKLNSFRNYVNGHRVHGSLGEHHQKLLTTAKPPASILVRIVGSRIVVGLFNFQLRREYEFAMDTRRTNRFAR